MTIKRRGEQRAREKNRKDEERGVREEAKEKEIRTN